jgi:hypothetical protein
MSSTNAVQTLDWHQPNKAPVYEKAFVKEKFTSETSEITMLLPETRLNNQHVIEMQVIDTFEISRPRPSNVPEK